MPRFFCFGECICVSIQFLLAEGAIVPFDLHCAVMVKIISSCVCSPVVVQAAYETDVCLVLLFAVMDKALITVLVGRGAIALVVAHPAPLLPLPLILPPSPLPLLLLAALVAISIALFVASAFTCRPFSLPSCCLGWGRGGPYQSGAQSYFGCHRRCRHYCFRLCRPRDWPGGAVPTMRGISMPSRQLAPM